MKDTVSFPTPVSLLQTLIQFDTTNPPGNEAECVRYLGSLLAGAGIEPTYFARASRRPNMIARLPGRGEAPPFLMVGHVDVVTSASQNWTHPPFSGAIADGFVWGRGALDMKGGVAMMVSAFLRAKTEGFDLPGDVILAILSDEEVDGEYGAKYLVENHAEVFEGVRYAIGEGGGFSLRMGGRKFYTVMVGEKQICSIRATLRGPGGHGSLPVRGGAMAGLGAVLQKLDRGRLPVHITPIVRQMMERMGAALPFPKNVVLSQLLNPALTDWILDRLGAQGALLDPVLHNTVSPTIVNGGHKINVIPSQVSLEMDGRLLPNFQPEDMLKELGQMLGDGVALEVTRFDPGPGDPDMGLFDTLSELLREADPEGIPLPILLTGVTDARYFASLGIQTYGFTPMELPEGLIRTAHGEDERVPVEAVGFGTGVIASLLQRFGG